MFSRKIAVQMSRILSCIYACHVIERFCVAGSNKRNDYEALYCSKDL